MSQTRGCIAIGMNARLFPNNWRPALAEIAFARDHGFAALQLPGPERGLDAERLGAELDVVALGLRAAGVQPVLELLQRVDASGHTASALTPLDVLRNLPAIAQLSCRYVHWHLVPSTPMEPPVIAGLERCLQKQFMDAVTMARQHGFRFGFEHNEPELQLYSTPESCLALLQAVPGLHFVWDFNHTIPEHLAGFLELIPRLSMLHVSDTPLPEVNHHLPLGLGGVDVTAYCRALLQGGFVGPAIFEIGGLPKSGGYRRDTDEALLDSRRRLSIILEQLEA